jgi:replicative DNA helicase
VPLFFFMQNTIENKILASLLSNQDFTRKVLPFLDEAYFTEKAEKAIFLEAKNFFEKYNSLPTKDAILITLSDSKGVDEKTFTSAKTLVESFGEVAEETRWLEEQTEQFCQSRAIINAIQKSIHIIDGQDKVYGKDAIPNILQSALSVSFNRTIGHDYVSSAEERYDFYHKTENKIPFDLSIFNKITNGGVPKKSLAVLVAETGKGKSQVLCHHAAHCLKQNLNVLYITLEMAEERIAERIDANLLDITTNDLKKMSKKEYLNAIDDVTSKIKSKLIIKEYPTSGAHAGHFDALIEELKIKKKFIPDVIMVDYLNICISQRYKPGGSHNSYTIVKGIAEELRGLAVKHNVSLWSATQFNRGAINNSNPDLSNVSESTGLSHTADFFFALISTEELEKDQQIMVKQLKNRYGDINYYGKFLLGVNRAKMKFYDLDDIAATDGITQDKSTDNSEDYSFSKFKGNYDGISD